MAETPTFTMRATPEQQPILREVCRFVRTRPDGEGLLRRFLDEVGRRTQEEQATAALPSGRLEAIETTLAQVAEGLGSVSQRITDTGQQAEEMRETLRREFAQETAQLVERITELTHRVTDLERPCVAVGDTVETDRVTDEAPPCDPLSPVPATGAGQEAETARRIEEAKGRIDAMRAEGLSQRAIAERLNAEGVGTPIKQGKWSQSGVSDFIKAHSPLPS